jgi:hypothetical protein
MRARAIRSRSRATSARATCSIAEFAEFAADYADQNERDYAALLDAIASGRVQAQTGL